MAVDAHAAADPTTDEAVVDALADEAAGPIGIVACADEAAGPSGIVACADEAAGPIGIVDCAGPLVVCTASNAGASSDVDVVDIVVVLDASIVVIFGPGVDIVRWKRRVKF